MFGERGVLRVLEALGIFFESNKRLKFLGGFFKVPSSGS